MYEVHSGQNVLFLELTASCSSYQFDWSNSGTRGAIVFVTEDYKVTVAKGDMLDPKLAQYGLQAMAQVRQPNNTIFDWRFICLSKSHNRIFLADCASNARV